MKHARFNLTFKVLLVFLSLALFFVFFAGKEKEAAVEEAVEVTEPASAVTIDFWHQDWPGGINWMTAYIKKFNDRHANITVNLIPVPFDELFTKLIPSVAHGNEPALMFGYSDWVYGKDVSKLFCPLTPTLFSVDEFKNYIYNASMIGVIGSDGEIYGLPVATGANAFGFVYHKDLFKEAGVDASKIKSWDDLKAAAKKLTVYNPDGSIKRSGILFSYTESANAFLDMIQMQGARDKMLDTKSKEWNLNIPEARKAMETFKWFVDNKVYDPESGSPFHTFPNKIGAMLLIGPWDVGASMTDFPELDVGYILMPPFPKGGDKLVLGSVISYFDIFTSKRLTGDERNAALLFIKDLMTAPEEYFDIAFYQKPPFWVGAVCNKGYVADLEKRSSSEMNAFSKTALDATKIGLPAVNTLDTKIPEPILIRQAIYPEMESVFLEKKSIDQMLEYLTSYLTGQEKALAD